MYFALKQKIQSCDEKGSENIGTLLGTLPLVYFAKCLKELYFTTVTVSDIERRGSLILTAVYWCCWNTGNNKINNIAEFRVTEVGWIFKSCGNNASYPKLMPIILTTHQLIMSAMPMKSAFQSLLQE